MPRVLAESSFLWTRIDYHQIVHIAIFHR
jgi:hypothetical protein